MGGAQAHRQIVTLEEVGSCLDDDVARAELRGNPGLHERWGH